ncbi:protein LTV1 homolog [Onthophagus taurus]|uniref:protein LTV1 homolog n=1 Tax=Onthophagus taurus TaxID=166361 RepID=UPI0039BE9530
MPKKKFIDRKKAVTFHLVHRSQQDPLAADDSAPQRVLVAEKSKSDKRLEEQQKYGIYFDDDYNYLQHLRESGTTEWEQVQPVQKKTVDKETKLKLPSSVFASEVEEDVGLLNKAAPQSGLRLDLDPDVVAAMDDDFNFSDPENELEDNFIELANAEISDDEMIEEEEEDVSSDFGSEEDDELGSLDGPQFTFKDEETKSRFTDYSMSSSVIRRNKQLSLLDDRFEKMYEGYDENEIGALDCEDIEGFVPQNSDILLQYADEFEKQQAREKLDKEAIVNKLKIIDSDSEEELVEMVQENKEKWDCESILSTYSNLYNHPKVIELPHKSKIRINMKTGMPINENKLTAKALSKLNEEYDEINKKVGSKSVGEYSVLSTLSVLSIRPKDESPEEKKERKRLLKEYRRERRVEKKIHKDMFKENHLNAIRQKSHCNTPGNKIL